MMPSDFHFRNKVPVAILDAAGALGQRWVSSLAQHPWFEIKALVAKTDDTGKPYGKIVRWSLQDSCPASCLDQLVGSLDDLRNSSVIILNENIQEQIVHPLLSKGKLLLYPPGSINSVPILIPELTPSLEILFSQKNSGKRVSYPSTILRSLVFTLKPLQAAFGIKESQFFLAESVAKEAQFTLRNEIENVLGLNKFLLQTHPQILENMLRVKLKLQAPATKEALIEKWKSFKGMSSQQLLSSNEHPLSYTENQKTLDPNVSHLSTQIEIGAVQELGDSAYQFTLTYDDLNPLRGGLIAMEFLLREGRIFW